MTGRFAILVAAIAATLVLTLAEASAIPMRKNIDLLTPDELAAYEHAIRILRDRSNTNPFDKTGYLWQAWVHNCTFIWVPASGSGPHGENCDDARVSPGAGFVASHPGVCEHGKDLFLPWHRAEFYYFEKLLQAADPDGTVTDSRGITGPSTRDVAVPFWNWTRKPSGVRYPKALENPASPLFHAKRIQTALTDDEKDAFKDVTSANAVASLVYSDWKTMGGVPQEAPVGGFGGFEANHHNIMHGSYFGGDMANARKAALDPGFYSFHAYIDLVYQFWLTEHSKGTVTSPNHFLRADEPEGVMPPPGFQQGAGLPSMGQVSIYFDPATLGYDYEVTADDKLPAPPTVAALLAALDGTPARFGATDRSPFARVSGDGVFDPASGEPTEVVDIAVPIPAISSEIQAAFSRPAHAPDVSFTVDFYLHPPVASFDVSNPSDRQKYIVVAKGYWGSGETSGHGEHSPDKPLFADLTGPVADLVAAGRTGETWTLTAVVSGAETVGEPFGSLTLMH